MRTGRLVAAAAAVEATAAVEACPVAIEVKAALAVVVMVALEAVMEAVILVEFLAQVDCLDGVEELRAREEANRSQQCYSSLGTLCDGKSHSIRMGRAIHWQVWHILIHTHDVRGRPRNCSQDLEEEQLVDLQSRMAPSLAVDGSMACLRITRGRQLPIEVEAVMPELVAALPGARRSRDVCALRVLGKRARGHTNRLHISAPTNNFSGTSISLQYGHTCFALATACERCVGRDTGVAGGRGMVSCDNGGDDLPVVSEGTVESGSGRAEGNQKHIDRLPTPDQRILPVPPSMGWLTRVITVH